MRLDWYAATAKPPLKGTQRGLTLVCVVFGHPSDRPADTDSFEFSNLVDKRRRLIVEGTTLFESEKNMLHLHTLRKKYVCIQ